MLMCHCRSPGYGLTLVSETTAGVLHSAELFSNQPLAQGSEGSREPHPPSLPEDIGRQTALLLIQEIVNVNIYYIDIMYGPNVAYLLYRGCQTIYIPMLNVILSHIFVGKCKATYTAKSYFAAKS